MANEQKPHQYQPKLNADALILGYLGKGPEPVAFAKGYLAAQPK